MSEFRSFGPIFSAGSIGLSGGFGGISASCWGRPGLGNNEAHGINTNTLGLNGQFSLYGLGNNIGHSQVGTGGRGGNNESFSTLKSSDSTIGGGNNASENSLCLNSLTQDRRGLNASTQERRGLNAPVQDRGGLNAPAQDRRETRAVGEGGEKLPTPTPKPNDNVNKEPVSFDSSKSLDQQKNVTVNKDAPVPEHKPLTEGEQPTIKVTSDTSKPADVLIKKDGTVEVHGNPEAGDKPFSEYRVAVEAGADQKTTDAVVNLLRDRITQKGENIQPTLDADQGLVSDAVRKAFDNNQKEDIPDDKGGVDNTNGNGNCDGGQKGDDTDIPDKDDGKGDGKDGGDGNTDGDTKAQVSSMDALRNGLITDRDAQGNPRYDNVTANQLGAYNMNFNNWVIGWFDDEELAEALGHPPDFKKLGKALKKRMQDPKFAQKMGQKIAAMREAGDEKGAEQLGNFLEKINKSDENQPGSFVNQLGDFMSRQQQGTNATPDELKTFFGKDMQDAAMSSRIVDAAKAIGVTDMKDIKDPAKVEPKIAQIALTMLTDHAVTAKEKDDMMKNKIYADYVAQVQDTFKHRKHSST